MPENKPVIIRPMLAAQEFRRDITQKHLDADSYMYVQPKIDGFRYMFDDGVARSRSWKVWKHRGVQAFAAAHADLVHGWDGEGTPGHEHDPEGFRVAMSELRAETGSDTFTLWLFDNFDPSWATYTYEGRRWSTISDLLGESESTALDDHLNTWDTPERLFQGPGYNVKVKLCPTFQVRTLEEIDALYARFLEMGLEGAILRRKGRGYKYNRATTLEGALTKIKPEDTFEARITGVYARERNDNEAKTSALGYTTRSAHKANKVAVECVGGFECELLSNPAVTFNVGVLRLSQDEKERLWTIRDQIPGRVIKCLEHGYKGGYDKPRTPVMVSWADEDEL